MRFFERFLNWIRAHALASSLVFMATSPFVAFEVYASVYAMRYDDCTFGSVSNARYRELLRRARWLHWSKDMFFIRGQFSDATSGQHEPAHVIVDLNLSNRLSEISGKS